MAPHTDVWFPHTHVHERVCKHTHTFKNENTCPSVQSRSQAAGTYLAVRTSTVPLSFSSLSFSKYISLDWRRTNQRRFQFLLDSVEEPPPFLCSQPCLRASCLERNHRKVSSLRTHQRRFQEFIKPPVPPGRGRERVTESKPSDKTHSPF